MDAQEYFLQWFASYDEAVLALDDFDQVIRHDARFRLKFKVSRPRALSKGYALYAIPLTREEIKAMKKK